MFNLKTTLGKESDISEISVSRVDASKIFHKGKNASIWAIDPEQEESNEENKQNIQKLVLQQFQKQLVSIYHRDSTFTEVCFYEIIGHLHTVAPDLEETNYLGIIHDNAQNLLEYGDEPYKLFLKNLLQYLTRRIRKLKKKEKMNELQEYEKIVKNNFKKKSVQFIEEDKAEKQLHYLKNLRKDSDTNNGSTSQLNGSNSGSTEGKLGLLLGSSKPKDEKKAEGNINNEESISFSTMINNNMAVRQRGAKDKKKDKKQPIQSKIPKGNGEEDGNNDAFIFYRPKGTKNK